MKARKIIVELKNDKFVELKAVWESDDEKRLKEMFGRNMQKDMLSMIFDEISKSMFAQNIELSDVKSIKFENIEEV